ncbi:helix-turn-helix domain-containing protein [Enterobacter asburiae]|uniref:helix-turn-helix domain-containing protein n=1 Tax=Enterobacter asburiae TaxID=61645 RepID=UPI002003D26B|nr:helix-turn-helix domain-containing protein [Enterobacter asburiae]MCK7227249.1 helix-turn-helix domain-containing protein [Enterobacter asburiae]
MTENKSIMNPIRPEEATKRILAYFPPSKPFLMSVGQSLSPRKTTSSTRTYFLLEGMMICSLGSGEGKQNVALVKGPSILNAVASENSLDYTLESVTPCMVDSVSVADFRRIISENNLWEDLFEILSLRTQMLVMRAVTAGLPTAYDVIRSYLIYMDSETTYNLKDRYTIVKFMQTFTCISRSMILKILSELKVGKFIEVENGKLIKICRTLPDKF